MTAIIQFLVAADTLDTDREFTALDRRANMELRQILRDEGDIVMPAAADNINEIQSIAIFDGTVTAGTYTLSFSLWRGFNFTTAPIAYNADAATIDTAIQAASPVGVVLGDIVVTGGDLTTTPVTLTFSGGSVNRQNHNQTTIDGSSLVGGTAGAATTTQNGQKDRNGWAILLGLGILDGTIEPMGVLPTDLVMAANPDERRISAPTIEAIAQQIAADEKNIALYSLILEAAGIPV